MSSRALVVRDSEVSFLNSGLGGMDAESTLKKLKLAATCFLCSGYFKDPVILDCGHNFCHTCLFDCWRDFLKDIRCPQCKRAVDSRTVVQNRQLASAVGLIKQLSDEASQTQGKDHVCRKHHIREPLEFYCKDDLTLLCSVCKQSLEHQAHCVVPVEEAAEDFKHYFNRYIVPLKDKKEKMMAYKLNTEEEYQRLLTKTETGKQNLIAQFLAFQRYLKFQENLVVPWFQNLQGEIGKKKQEWMTRLFDDISSCNRIIRELEEKCQQPAGDFLQDVRGTMERLGKASFKDPVSVEQELKWESFELCDLNLSLWRITDEFRAALQGGYRPCIANVTLDAETAHPRFILTHLKTMRLGDEVQSVPKSWKRFNECLFVLGCESFKTGRYFWDVLVENEGDWAVGVAKQSVKRKGCIALSPEAGIWAVGKRAGWYVFFKFPRCTYLALNGELKKVRVFLNCVGREVTFLDADRKNILFTTSISFHTKETFLPFFYLSDQAQLTIAP